MVRLVEAGSADVLRVPANGWMSVRVNGEHIVEVVRSGEAGGIMSTAARDGSYRVSREALTQHALVVVRPAGAAQFAADAVLNVRVAPGNDSRSVDVDDVRPGGLRSVQIAELVPFPDGQRVRVERIPQAGLHMPVSPAATSSQAATATSVEAIASSVVRQRVADGTFLQGAQGLVVDGSVSARRHADEIDVVARLIAAVLGVTPAVVLDGSEHQQGDRRGEVGLVLEAAVARQSRGRSELGLVVVTDLPPFRAAAGVRTVVVTEPDVLGVLEPADGVLALSPADVELLHRSRDDAETRAIVEQVVDFLGAGEDRSKQ